MYFRTNIPQEMIGELLFVDQSTISRAINDLEEILTEALGHPNPFELLSSCAVTVACIPTTSQLDYQ
jgi:fructose-specific component phosphotransferase system IIB-like protein